jgi:hypothetical protein
MAKSKCGQWGFLVNDLGWRNSENLRVAKSLCQTKPGKYGQRPGSDWI